MITSEQSSDRSVVLHVRGTFDAAAARQLHDLMGKVTPGSRVLIDFSQVRDSHDFAVAVLAEELARALGRASVLGLSQHQRRLLRYFGIEDEELQPVAEPVG